MASSFGLTNKHKLLSQRQKAVLLGPIGNGQCSSQDNAAKSSKQHSMHIGIMTLHKFQKACGIKKKSFALPNLQDKPKYTHRQVENDAIKQHRPCNPFNTSTSVNRLFHVRYETHHMLLVYSAAKSNI